MQFLTVALISLLAGSSTHPAPTTTGSDDTPPPGMVLIPGGRTKVGSSLKDITKLFEEHTEAREKAKGFFGEVPEHSVSVGDFYLARTELTNEQYREYVVNAGGRPPFLWAQEAIDKERARFLKEAAEERKKARDEGRPMPDRRAFEQEDAERWWDRNWKDQPWEMPKDLAKKPVVYVSYADANLYAEWAGFRLPTEHEFERASRNGSSDMYPWGDKWKRGMAVTRETKNTSSIMDVGSFPDGANKQGVMDLVGNVWEWTSSPYTEYPGWKHKKVKVGRGKNQRVVDDMPSWSANKRIVKSGGQPNAPLFARSTIRGGFERFMRNNALGFRCAASLKAGLDFAVRRMREIPSQTRPFNGKGPITYDPNAVIAMDRWTSAAGTSTIPGYAMVASYDYVLFTPAEAMETNGVSDIRKGAERDELFHVGYFASKNDLVEPALPAGLYLVAIRGAAKYPDRKAPVAEDEGEGEAEAVTAEEPLFLPVPIDEFLEINPKKDNYIFINMEGVPVASMLASKLNYGNPKSGNSSIGIVDREATVTVTGPDGKDVKETRTQQWVDINYFVKGKSRKGLTATLSLRFADGAMDGVWRR